jgi:phospholipase C
MQVHFHPSRVPGAGTSGDRKWGFTVSSILPEIDTIVVLMMESRSFDHVLGHLSLDKGPYEGHLEGLRGTPIDGRLVDARYENTCEGRIHYPFEMRDGAMPHDLLHEREDVKVSLGRTTAEGSRAMDGFVRSYYRSERAQRSARPLPLGFLRATDAPVTNFLARSYAICDRWFAPLPAGATPNRLVATCGYSLVPNASNGLLPHHHTVFDWMKARGVRFRVYHEGLSFFTLCTWMLDDLTSDRFRDTSRLIEDVASEPDATFPQVILVEPSYFDAPTHLGRTPNDNHPRMSMEPGERFLLRVYEALTSNPERFRRTLFVVTYASHGGFYDHVPPLPVQYAQPGAQFAQFETTGLRVPAIVVSPHVEPGTVYGGQLDHTSILQLVAEKFGGGEPYSEAVASRARQGIGSVSAVLNRALAQPRAPVPPSPRARPGRRPRRGRTPQSSAEHAFFLAAQELCERAPSHMASVYPELFRSLKRGGASPATE